MARTSGYGFSKNNQAWRFERFIEKITNAILSRAPQIIRFKHYGISGKAALRETRNIITRLGIIVRATIWEKQFIEIIPV